MKCNLAMLACGLLILALSSRAAAAEDLWVSYTPGEGPGKGKHIVLVSGDDEYRSEEALPQLGKILAKHHGFRCTVLFAVDPATGNVSPGTQNNIPGLESLKTADLCVMGLRFRNLPDEQMQHLAEYFEAGKPVVALRTSTHAFNLDGKSKYQKYHWANKGKEWDGGFGRHVLGETWISHHGGHGSQSTRGILAEGQEKHPILRGIKSGDIWGPTDVYGVTLPLPGDSQPLVLGQVVEGMKFDDKPAEGPKNNPMMPVAWTKSYQVGEKTGRAFTTTMGASQDFLAEGTRRMVVNACYWALGMEEQIPEKSKVDLVGTYEPSKFSFNGAKQGVKPADHAERN